MNKRFISSGNGVQSAMRAASQLPGGATVFDDDLILEYKH